MYILYHLIIIRHIDIRRLEIALRMYLKKIEIDKRSKDPFPPFNNWSRKPLSKFAWDARTIWQNRERVSSWNTRKPANLVTSSVMQVPGKKLNSNPCGEKRREAL